jgi:hypothetical protein
MSAARFLGLLTGLVPVRDDAVVQTHAATTHTESDGLLHLLRMGDETVELRKLPMVRISARVKPACCAKPSTSIMRTSCSS